MVIPSKIIDGYTARICADTTKWEQVRRGALFRLEDMTSGTSQLVDTVVVSLAMCTDLPKSRVASGVMSHTFWGFKTQRRDIWEVSTWSVGTMKGRVLTGTFGRRYVNILCVQETKQKKDKAKEIGNEYKMKYTGKTSKRNIIGVMLDEAMKTNVEEMIKKRNRIIVVKLVLEVSIVRVI